MDNRHPAGTSVGGQWAPGSAEEIDLDDALDETFAADWAEAAEEEEYPVADDGGFDFGIEGAGPKEERFLHVRGETRTLDLSPGDVAVVESTSGRDSFVIGGSRGIAVLEPSEQSGCYEMLSMSRADLGSTGVTLGGKGTRTVKYDDWHVDDEEFVPSDDVDEYSKFPRDGRKAKEFLLKNARTNIVGSLSSSGERRWCEERSAGPEFASHPLAREKAYDFVSARPDLEIRPSLSDDEHREWDEFDGLGPDHARQVFAHRRLSSNAEEHYFADGDSIFVHRYPENETEKIA